MRLLIWRGLWLVGVLVGAGLTQDRVAALNWRMKGWWFGGPVAQAVERMRNAGLRALCGGWRMRR